MNYATIKYCDIANGTGVRTSLFVSGCRRHCPECFNAVAWDFGYGLPFDKAVRNEILGSLAPVKKSSPRSLKPVCVRKSSAVCRPSSTRSLP